VFLEIGIKKARTNSDVLSSESSKPSVTLYVLTGKRKRIFALTAQACVAKQSRQITRILFFSFAFIKLLGFSLFGFLLKFVSLELSYETYIID
jgi:hypothetical protein